MATRDVHHGQWRFRPPFLAVLVVPVLWPVPSQAMSILERVLASIESSSMARLNFLFANVAESFGVAPVTARSLAPGDAVVIGYEAGGLPRIGLAGPEGLTVTSDLTDRGGAGVPPGIYPVGSPLFQLPGGAQLSLYNADARGGSLSAAYFDPGRIDGSINTFIYAGLPQLTADIQAISMSTEALFDIDRISATALGAVNAGQIVTSVEVDYIQGIENADSNIRKALLATGSNLSQDLAQTDRTLAFAMDGSALGGSSDSAILAANIAANMASINGSINMTIHGASIRVENAVTTALGAVNGGEIVISSDDLRGNP